MTFTIKLDKALKQIALIWLPAIAALYSGSAAIWHLGDISEVVGTITTIDTFLGVILHLSGNPAGAAGNPDGKLVIDTSNPVKDVYSIELDTTFENLSAKDSITLQIHKN